MQDELLMELLERDCLGVNDVNNGPFQVKTRAKLRRYYTNLSYMTYSECSNWCEIFKNIKK